MRSSEPTTQKTSSINGSINKSISPRLSFYQRFYKGAGRKKLISFEDMIQREKNQFLLTISNPLDSSLNDTYVQIL